MVRAIQNVLYVRKDLLQSFRMGELIVRVSYKSVDIKKDERKRLWK
jgi:hypothetical protein